MIITHYKACYVITVASGLFHSLLPELLTQLSFILIGVKTLVSWYVGGSKATASVQIMWDSNETWSRMEPIRVHASFILYLLTSLFVAFAALLMVASQ